MVLLLEVGDQVIPDKTLEFLVSGSDRQISSLRMLTLALCTTAHHTEVDQKRGGEADQMWVDHGGPIGAVLVVAQPPQRRGVLHKRHDRPPASVRQHEGSR